jgi:F-box/WD-40 domain protein 5
MYDCHDPYLVGLGKTSWFSEYLRLWQHTPILESEVLKGHTHQVLHVSFSHNGKYFATCSKDGYVMVKP